MLAQAATEFESHRDSGDPGWAAYFDEYELAAEFAHCYYALGMPRQAISYASRSLNATSGDNARSDFFVTMILASALLEAGEQDEALEKALDGLDAGDPIRSVRCIEYVRDFRRRLPSAESHNLRSFHEQAETHQIWLHSS